MHTLSGRDVLGTQLEVSVVPVMIRRGRPVHGLADLGLGPQWLSVV